MATILPEAKTQFTDALGVPLAGGSVYFYMPNTTTPKDTYQDATQTILNTNPVILDSAGRAIILGSGAYRQVVYDVNGNLIWDQTTSEAVVGQTSFGGTSTGSANAQIVSAGSFSGADGSVINFTAGFTNTGSMTVQVGLAASPIAVLKNGPSGPTNLVAGDITAGNVYSISYSVSLGVFQLLQSLPAAIVIASQAEAQAGVNNTNVMTPLRTNQAIQVLGIPASLAVAQGDLLYATSANTWVRLPKGTANQQIRMNAGVTAPEWFTDTGAATRAFAYYTMSGTTITVQKQLNVASVTRTGTGAYTVVFTNAMADANYVITFQCEDTGSNQNRAVRGVIKLTTGFSFTTSQLDDNQADANRSNFAVFS